ncbi:hypothetical protein A3F38_02870 [Candidatus Saccharibacteria bacterium RIFCSPHIGHO2_12_FULL_48_21]|nr:MAG: hypothetical protein A3F38_02870 [Candidatus Saccharibacteria bacterium RIFCSPHIGHO2_12_FULL_48_21]
MFVLSKNVRSATNVLFAILCVALIGWTTANYFSVTLTNPQSIFASIKVIFAFVVLQNTAFLLFVRIFPATHGNFAWLWIRIYILLSAFIGAMALGGLFFEGYEYTSQGGFNLLAAPPIGLFIAHAVFSIGWSIKKLFSRYKNSTGILRNQLLFLITASLLLLVLVPLTNFFLPIIFKNSTFVNLSPIYTSLFAGIIAYAIIKQKLFDIRLAVARSVAYILSLVTLVATYSFVLFTASQLIVGGSYGESFTFQALNVAFLVVLAFSFQPIKRFFDRITNRLFYRDAYETQDVLDKLGNVVVAEIDLHRILSGTRTVLTDALRSKFIEFILFEKNKPYLQSVGQQGLKTDLEQLSTHIDEQKREVVVTDELGPQNLLKSLLSKDEISVSLRLKTHHQLVGYVLFGSKRSGDMYSTQDIDLLEIVADELAVAVQNALRFEEIKQFNITLQRKIEEATAELRHANSRLKELDKTKDEFISMASHQLRTPLTAVKGYLSMVLEGDVGPVTKEEKAYIKRAFDSAQKMVYLIADMLNVSRLQTGKFVIEIKPTNLAEVVASEVDQLKEQIDSRKLKLIYQKPDKLPTLNLDETKTRQVVMNFIDNAIYYTPSGGTIEVKLQSTDDSVSFTVTDTGLGVPKAVQHHLFAKFYRADNAKKMRPDGTGLGLFMAKKVIVAQGGAIIFKSEEGKGSTFGFSFPRKGIEVKASKTESAKETETIAKPPDDPGKTVDKS